MKREAEEWIRIAEEDLRAAVQLMQVPLYRMVCYHAQQLTLSLVPITNHDYYGPDAPQRIFSESS